MKVTVDASRCEGRGYCARLAPLVFESDEDGYPRVLVTQDLDEEQLADARTAVSACPEQAIALQD
ncbi:ferredoxin [Yinghuangia seranimata]|uniref:ferredoxin n=1 Tax=Yinghuangia seranimata TaxID=408067 RepID=UPI00248AE8C8|nr:ferredoxin [Yinghuangia seranimata]MDI2132441.1 ferredoxin [Yinghuangia seranimata]